MSALVALVLFAPVVHHGFVYDDVAIAGDTRLHDPWFGLTVWISQWWPRGASVPISRPLTQFTYWLQVQTGLGSPMWFHLIDLMLYAGLCAMVAWLAGALKCPRPNFRGRGELIPPALVGIGFAVHPLHVEVVSSMVGRADTMAMMFTVLGIGLWLRWRGRGQLIAPAVGIWRRGAIIALVVLLAGLCKESGYLLAPMLGVIELAMWRRAGAGAGPINWPRPRSQFIATAVCVGVVVLVAAGQRWVMSNNIPKDAFRGGLSDMDNPMVLANASERLVTPVKLIGQAGRLMVWPAESRRGQFIAPAGSPDYSPRMLMPTDRLDDPLVIGGLLICGAWGVWVILAWRKRSDALGPLLCLPIAWAIPSNTVMLIGTIFAERLLMPVSLFVMLAVAGGINSPRRRGHLSAPAWVVLIVVWAVVSFLYIPAWHDNQTLQGYTVSYHPNSGRFQAFFANSVLETAFKAEGNPKLKSELLDVAAEHARLALEYWPRNAGPFAILGVVEAERGNPRKAAEYLKYARENSVDFHIGDWYEHRIGQLESADALQYRADALREKADAGETDPALAAELGQVYVKLRQWPLAYKQFEKLDVAAITDTQLLRDYIDAAITMGKMDTALAAEEHWMTLKPDQWDVLTDAAILAINAGLKIDQAKQWLDKAVELAPANAQPWAGLCMWYQFKGERDRAVEAIRRAIALSGTDDPRYPHYQWILENLMK
ncbi:MAG: hypothetical protein WC058_08380 [Phycisphaeraceae bacterium]